MRSFLGFCPGLGALLALASFEAAAGGSGLNVLVVVNQDSSNSVQLGNYYCEQRHVPPQNLLRIYWAGSNIEWTPADFTNVLLNPLRDLLVSRQLTNQIDYVVLSMDIPYRVSDPTNGMNSTTSALFYGFKPDNRDPGTCPVAPGSASAYAGTESLFRATTGFTSGTNFFLATMITSTSLDLARRIVDQGVSGDNTFPTQPVVLAKSSDPARNIRYATFDNAVFNSRLRGISIQRTNAANPPPVALLGFQNGIYAFTVQSNNFVPGAMADNLTSFGGLLFENTGGQTTLLSFLEAGAAGSYGTVVEPCAYLSKFPDPRNYFYQARGLSLAECYYQSLTNPYEGLIVGEPLSAPFAQPAAGSWLSPGSNAVLAGTTNLSVQFSSIDPRLPLRHADLFLDGTWLQSATNLPPTAGDVLTVTINGFSTNFVVPSNSIVRTVTTGLASNLNNAAFAGPAGILAFTRGDRIELQCTNPALSGAQIALTVQSSNSVTTPTTFIAAAGSNFLDSVAWGFQTFTITGIPATDSFLNLLVIPTNGMPVNVALTNTDGGDLTAFAQSFLGVVNSTPELQVSNGVAMEDLETLAGDRVQFHLRALAPGFAAAQIQAVLSASTVLVISPAGSNSLTRNLADLCPRDHIYIAAGTTNLALNFPFNTAALPDGYHELAVVVYEGSHVHTQSRATQFVKIQNTPLAATFATLLGGSNTALEATLQFKVTANTNAIAKIELYSTGGLVAAAINQASATFSIDAVNLDLGLHPFYALVTAANGTQYRTETKWIRLVGLEEPFSAQFSAPPPLLVWAAAAGRSYDILSTTNQAQPFQLRATVFATNSLGQWTEPNPLPPQQFYRVRVSL